MRQLRGEPAPAAGNRRPAPRQPRQGRARPGAGRARADRRGATMAAEIIAFSHEHGNLRGEHSGWHYTADCALLEDKCVESLALYRTSLLLARETGDRLEIGFEIQGVAMSLAGLGDSRARAVAGRGRRGRVRADRQHAFTSSSGMSCWPGTSAWPERHSATRRRERAWSRGRATAFDEAIEDALRAD